MDFKKAVLRFHLMWLNKTASYSIYFGGFQPAIVFRGTHVEIFGPTTATIIYTAGALVLTIAWLSVIKNFLRK